MYDRLDLEKKGLLNLSKEEATALLDMRKDTVQELCLTKIDLNGLTARVAMVLDVSGSMLNLFENGMVQATVERVLPLAMNFDDNGEMELWTFSKGFCRQKAITRDNFYNYVKDNLDPPNGGTNYAPVIEDICKYFAVEEPENLPNYIIFITDGDNWDTSETNKIIKLASYFPIFIQFVGIGDGPFTYLEELDEMEGRYVDNANFFALESIADTENITDEDLYSKLLKEYPEWLKYPRVRAMIAEGKDKKANKKKMKKLSKEYKLSSFNVDLDGIGLIAEIIDCILDIFT